MLIDQDTKPKLKLSKYNARERKLRRELCAMIASVALFVMLAFALIGVCVNRMANLSGDIDRIERTLRTSAEAREKLWQELDGYMAAIERVDEKVAARPEIHIKYGTVYNLDGEVAVEETTKKGEPKK